jgi:DNA polymerase I-like protein with 3'-5' exonuclease and polymerase domains
MWRYDEEYVKEMMVDGFDPHLDIAVQSGMMTETQANQYKGGDKTEELDKIRYNAKTANYASTYGAGAATIARQAGMSEREARKLHKAYWERNWSVKAIADETIVKNVKGKMWLYNPVSKFWYFLKADKDRFSTLNQGTGTFLFDMWVKELKKGSIKLLGQFHDEVIAEVKQGQREEIKRYFKLAVKEVNNKFHLYRVLDVDVQFGKTYAGIH